MWPLRLDFWPSRARGCLAIASESATRPDAQIREPIKPAVILVLDHSVSSLHATPFSEAVEQTFPQLEKLRNEMREYINGELARRLPVIQTCCNGLS